SGRAHAVRSSRTVDLEPVLNSLTRRLDQAIGGIGHNRRGHRLRFNTRSVRSCVCASKFHLRGPLPVTLDESRDNDEFRACAGGNGLDGLATRDGASNKERTDNSEELKVRNHAEIW